MRPATTGESPILLICAIVAWLAIVLPRLELRECYDWDSVQYGWGTQRYSIAEHRSRSARLLALCPIAKGGRGPDDGHNGGDELPVARHDAGRLLDPGAVAEQTDSPPWL
jgi:hypothetical protein